jgi:large-conductance mechanosensitive channel
MGVEQAGCAGTLSDKERQEAAAPPPPADVVLLGEIRDLLKERR